MLRQEGPLATQRVGLQVPHPQERVHARQRLAPRERVDEAIVSLDIIAERRRVEGTNTAWVPSTAASALMLALSSTMRSAADRTSNAASTGVHRGYRPRSGGNAPSD